MFTDKHVTVSTRVVKVVRHSQKEWLLISRAVVNSFVGIGGRHLGTFQTSTTLIAVMMVMLSMSTCSCHKEGLH